MYREQGARRQRGGRSKAPPAPCPFAGDLRGLSLVSLGSGVSVPLVFCPWVSFVSAPRYPRAPLTVPVSCGLRPSPSTPSRPSPPSPFSLLLFLSHLSVCLIPLSPSMLLSSSLSLPSSSLSVSPSSVWASPLLCFHLLSPPVSTSSISPLIWKKLSLHWPLCFPTLRGWTLQTPLWTLSDARGPHPAMQGLRSAFTCPRMPPPQDSAW